MHIHSTLFPTLFFFHALIFSITMNYSDAKFSAGISEVFSIDEEANGFIRLAVDKYGRWVYVSTKTNLYQLTSDLKLQIKHAVTELNSAYDSDDYDDSDDSDNLEEYKLNVPSLVLDYYNQQLISCNILHSLILCHAHSISNITKISATLSEKYRRNDQYDKWAGMVTFVASFLPYHASTPLSALYIGFRGGLHIRNLQPTHFLSLVEQKFPLNPGKHPIDANGVRFVNSFSYQNSGYFLMAGVSAASYSENATANTLSKGSGYLFKIDQDEQQYPYSYNDVFLTCNNYSSKAWQFRLLKHAYVYEEYVNKSSNSSIEAKETTIFGLFNVNNGVRNVAFVVCKYHMNKIQFPAQRGQILNEDAIFHHEGNLDVTAMAVTSINNHVVLFLGTNRGHLHKVSIKGFHSPDASTAHYYSDITIDKGSPVNSDILFDSTFKFLYVMSNKTLAKVRIYNCDQYNTLYGCLSAQDPYCGWCLASNRCCLETECTSEEQNTIEWISIDIEKYVNTSLSTGNDFFKTQQWNKTFSLMKSHPFNNYSAICNSYKSCSTCVSSVYPCEWHVYEHKCIVKAVSNKDGIIIGVNFDQTANHRFSKDQFYCPQFTLSDWPKSDIYIDVDTPRDKTLRMEYKIPKGLSNEAFKCEFNIAGKKITHDAILRPSTMDTYHDYSNDNFKTYATGVLECKNVTFAYPDLKPNITIQWYILWNGSKPLDNADNIRIILYKCAYVSNQCKTCLDWQYCEWNAPTKECVNYSYDYPDTPDSIYYRNNNIREMRWECRDAKISSFAPKLGPWEGGTSISIRINNLGDKLPLSWNVTIGDTPCTISPNSTGKANENLLCVLEECKSPTENCTGPIKLIAEDLVLTSTTIFEIVDPKIKHIKPTQGSTRGGTDLTIYGDYMNAGGKIEVYIDDLECVVFESSSLRLKCITGPSKQPFKSTVTVKFDGHSRTSENVYEYNEDMEPNENVLEVPRGVPSGGPNISITFDIPAEERIARDDKILFYIRDNELEKTYYSECEISIISLICPTPRMCDIDVHALNEQKPKLMDYGFKIRANTTNGTFLSYLHVHKKYPKFLLYPDSVQYLLENTGNKQTITSSVQSNNTAIILGAVLFIVTGIFVIYCIISVERWRKMQREMNALSMEIMVMSHLVKQVELEKEVDLYTSESDMLLQPDGRMLELPTPKLPKD